MITLREPEVVRGDVPGLLCRGMPLMADACDGVPRDQPVRGVVAALTPLDVAFEDYLPIEGTPGLVTAGRTIGGQGLTSDEIASRVAVDWSHPVAVDCALRWLGDRGHQLGWMRPRVYGGCIDDHGDLPAGTVSAILVARSVLNVAAGVAPPRTIARGYGVPTNTRMSIDNIGGATIVWRRRRVALAEKSDRLRGAGHGSRRR